MAGRIPQAFIDQLLERTSLVQLIENHIALKKQGTSFVANCPFHQEKTPSFNVIENKQFYYCFGCGASGNAISFLMDYAKQDFLTAINTLCSMTGLSLPDAELQTKIKGDNPLYALMTRVSHYYKQQLKVSPVVIDYLKKRGLNGEVAKTFQLGFAPKGWNNLQDAFANEKNALIKTGMLIKNDKGRVYDRYRNRVMFPIFDTRGRIIGFGGRSIEPDDMPKYLNSPETTLFNKSDALYGYYQMCQAGNPEKILVVEGYMDVIALFQHGLNFAVATLGTATTAHHISMLIRRAKALVFCFDGDAAGKKAAYRALLQCFSQINDNFSFKFMFLPEGEDPDSLIRKEGKESFLKRMDEAMESADFFFANLREELDLSTSHGRSQLVEHAKEALIEMTDGAYKSILIDKLAHLARIDKFRLEAWLYTNNETDKPANKTVQKRPTPLRTALALLIQNPKLYQKLEKPINPTILSGGGNEIFNELIQVIDKKTNTAQLIEHWRDSQHAGVINKLAALELSIPEGGLLAELKGALRQIQKSETNRSIEQMLKKASTHELTDSERVELQKLIKFAKETTEPD